MMLWIMLIVVIFTMCALVLAHVFWVMGDPVETIEVVKEQPKVSAKEAIAGLQEMVKDLS